MTQRRFHRHAAVGAVGLLIMSTLACAEKEADPETVPIGFIAPITGTYGVAGEEMQAAIELYLEVNGGKLGGRDVELVFADEANGPDDVMPDAERMVSEDEVVAVGGVLQGDTNYAVADLAQANDIPFIGSGGRPEFEEDQLDGVWFTSWVGALTGVAIAPYVLEEIDGPVYVIGPDYPGGHENILGFFEEYQKIGGEIANPDDEVVWTPFPDTTDFEPFLEDIAASDAEAIFTFYGGVNSVDFVKQWAHSDVKDLPVYSNFLTEGIALQQQGVEALGISSAVPYSPDLDNATNREFISEWSAAEDNTPSIAAVAAWDVGVVLDAAIGKIPADEEVTGEKINEAVGQMGEVNSPRGEWQFGPKTHAPIQRYYLREVRLDGEILTNVVIQDLATLGE
ncbi:MAG: ABC transporter substrate-binding protein [Stackebrandtia sp.]